MTPAALPTYASRGQARAVSDFDHPDYLNPLLPSQRARTAALSDGRRRLLWAILIDAVQCVQGGADVVGADRSAARTRFCQRRADEAAAWFAADDWEWPFSFVRVSEALGLDARALRAALPQARRRRRPRVVSGAMRVVAT